MAITLGGICEQKNNSNNILKATASSLIDNSNNGTNNILSYHDTVKEIIYDSNNIPNNVSQNARYLYSFKDNIIEDNGVINTNINNYNFTKSFVLNNIIYFLSDVYGIWQSILNTDGTLGEITQTTIVSGSYYDYYFVDQNNVKIFGDSVCLITNNNGINIITLEAETTTFSFVTCILPIENNIVLCGTYESGLKIYSNGIFTNTNINIGRITDIKKILNKFYASCEYNGIYSSIDNVNWVQTNIKNKTVTHLFTTSTGLFVTIYNNGIYKLNVGNGLFEQTNLINKKFNFVTETTEGIFTGGWATGIYKWDIITSSFIIFNEYTNEQYIGCVEKIYNNIKSIYFLGSNMVIYEVDNITKKLIKVVNKALLNTYKNIELTDNFVFMFSQNSGIEYYDRNNYLKDKVEIRIFNISIVDGSITYNVEPFNEGDRVVVLNSLVGKSIEYGLRNNYLIITESNENIINDNIISNSTTWSSTKISNELINTISNIKVDGGVIDGLKW